MFDEYIRAWDGWNAHLAYVKEAQEQAKEQGIEQGIGLGIEQGLQRGIEQGIAQEREKTINMIADLVKGGLLTREMGASKLNISEKEFEKYL